MTDDELDALERVYAAATQGKWHDVDGVAHGPRASNASADRAAIVALHNAFPALLREIRAGRKLADAVACMDYMHLAFEDYQSLMVMSDIRAALAKHGAARKGEP